MKFEKHIDNIIEEYYDNFYDKLYFIKYKGKILFLDKTKLEEHKHKDCVIDKFMKKVSQLVIHIEVN